MWVSSEDFFLAFRCTRNNNLRGFACCVLRLNQIGELNSTKKKKWNDARTDIKVIKVIKVLDFLERENILRESGFWFYLNRLIDFEIFTIGAF